MSRALTLMGGVLVLWLVAAPSGQAAAELTVSDMQFYSGEEELRIVPQKGFVTIRIVLNNTGDNATNATITVDIQITGIDNNYSRSDTIRRADVIDPGNETSIDYNWSPSGRVLGNHSVRVTIGGGNTVFTAFVDVAETAVPAGTIIDRVLSHYWFFGLFAVATILFIVVLAARRG